MSDASDRGPPEENRVVAPEFDPGLTGDEAEASLRPARLQDFVGQERLRENLKVFIEAARARDEALDHTLFYGPPGLGKTTLATNPGGPISSGQAVLSALAHARSVHPWHVSCARPAIT